MTIARGPSVVNRCDAGRLLSAGVFRVCQI